MTTAHFSSCPTHRSNSTWLIRVSECDFCKGYAAGVDAAREAVWESVGPSADAFSLMVLGRALAAIDELRNPPSLPPTTGRAHKY